jgi:enoyl-[acyl-carrier protein] reductase I
MGRFDGLKGLVLGVANDHSIAWAIAKEVMAEGGKTGPTTSGNETAAASPS